MPFYHDIAVRLVVRVDRTRGRMSRYYSVGHFLRILWLAEFDATIYAMITTSMT